MDTKYLDQQGLTTLLNSLASVCAKQSVLTALDNDTTNYLVEIDYDNWSEKFIKQFAEGL